MIALTCILGRIGGASAPPNPAMVAGQTLHDLFGQASAGDIELTIDGSRLAQDLNPSEVLIGAASLHKGLRSLTNNPSTTGPVSRIGIIYAREYANHPEVLGLMFDRGFSTVDDPNTAFQKVSREGCAIFVDSIARFRKWNLAATAAEIEFTTVHELGHVFNLEHTAGENFLATSVKAGPFGSGHYQFTSRHQGFLQRCSTCRCIQPGGTPFGNRAEIGQSFDVNATSTQNTLRAGRGRSPLRLELKLTQSSFWYCEPVELEIAVRLPGSGRATRSIPDRVDPGHGNLAIWIEEPNGERRLYRSPKFFCAIPKERIITSATPFVRDLSIFGQAGGYTFRRAGCHRIRASFEISPGTVLISNIVECEVRPPSPRWREFARMEPLLRRSAQLLYYRASPKPDAALALVEGINRVVPRTTTGAAARYALGRAFAAKALRHRSHWRQHARKALQLLSKAGDSGQLGRHSATRAAHWIEEMDSVLADD